MAIVLYTDFGADLYVGQVKAVLVEHAPAVPVIDLLHDAPAFDVGASAHLLAACLSRFAPGTVFLAVVDPGVGMERDAVVVECDGRYLVGPDNGLLSVCAARAHSVRIWSIHWRPAAMSASFHGRDLFAPIAAEIAAKAWPQAQLTDKPALDKMLDAGDAWTIIYIDRYGNACTGIRARSLTHDSALSAGGRRVSYARVFGAAGQREPFWYENSLGLAEVAANRASAAQLLGLTVGDAVSVA